MKKALALLLAALCLITFCACRRAASDEEKEEFKEAFQEHLHGIDTDDVYDTDIISIELTLPDGNTSYTFDDSNDDDDMMELFINTIENSTKMSKKPDNSSSNDYYLVKVYTADISSFYKFYYTLNPASCYYFNAYDGEFYKIDADDAENFLNSPYATPLYETEPPFYETETTPAKFYAGSTAADSSGLGICEIMVGEFITVTGLNVSDPSQITFQSLPDIGFTPTFFNDADTGSAIALIPFNYDLSAGEYALTFTYGGNTEIINVTVKERGVYSAYHPFNEVEVTIDANIIASAGTEDARKKAEEALLAIAKQESSSKRYWQNGETLYYATEGYGNGSSLQLKVGFGHIIKVKDTNIRFRNNGVDYTGKKGAEIGANLAGKVIYADRLDYCGYTVVIDHGYGLKSWYAHLGSIECSVGDEVQKGQTIGKIVSEGESSLSLTAIDGVHIGMTIYDVPVCTYALWTDSYRSEGYKGIVFYEE